MAPRFKIRGYVRRWRAQTRYGTGWYNHQGLLHQSLRNPPCDYDSKESRVRDHRPPFRDLHQSVRKETHKPERTVRHAWPRNNNRADAASRSSSLALVTVLHYTRSPCRSPYEEEDQRSRNRTGRMKRQILDDGIDIKTESSSFSKGI